MAINCGIVGLPNVGKSTIFSALTSIAAEAANYPFCTIDANSGVVALQDWRLQRISELISADRTVAASIEFVDIAGLVAGAAQGEGLGNRFLAHIREVGLLIHVVRCFDDPDIVHVQGRAQPLDDIETISTELALADLATVEKSKQRCERQTRVQDSQQRQKAKQLYELLKHVEEQLSLGLAVRQLTLDKEEKRLLKPLQLITAKEEIYLCNVDDSELSSRRSEQVKELAAKQNTLTLCLSGKLEAEIAAIEDAEERELFLADAGLQESGLSRLAKVAYHCLGLRSFFTVGGVENRAWTFPDGINAAEAAGLIHSDFERGFIKAEVYHCDDLFQSLSESQLRSLGKIRQEGRDYLVQDGDVMFFKFNL